MSVLCDEFFYFEKEDMKHICKEVLAAILGERNGENRLSGLKTAGTAGFGNV